MTPKKSLPPASVPSAGVRARVVARLRELSEQATLVAAAASVAACNAKEHGEGAVAAAGSGGFRGTAGYAVVDPLPWPAAGNISRPPIAPPVSPVPPPVVGPVCAPSLALDISSASASWQSKQQLIFSVAAPPAQANFAIFQLVEASASAGNATIGQPPSAGRFGITVSAAAWPATTNLMLVLKCWGITNEVTNARFALDTSQPADSGAVKVKYLTPALSEDAGVDDAGG